MRAPVVLLLCLACSRAPNDPLRSTPSASDAGEEAPPVDGGPVDAGDEPITPPAPFEPSTDARRRAAAICARSRRCGETSFRIAWGDSFEGCVDETTIDLLEVRRGPWRSAGYRQIDEAIRADRVRFDRAAFDACVTSYETAACDALQRCPPSFVGTVEEGRACHVDEECVGDRYCDADRAIACGVCRDRVGIGEPANRSGMCAAGTVFASVECFGVAHEGEACARLVRSREDAVCAPGLFCDGDTDIGVCTLDVRVGGACRRSSECEDANVCDAGRCAQAIPRAAGETCEAPFLVCQAALQCDANQTCVPLPGAGEACSADERCAAGSDCRAGRCEAKTPVGERCPGLASDDASCEPGAVCDEAYECAVYRWRMCVD